MTIKRRLQKLANTKNVIAKQYIQYPDLDNIQFWVYLPNKKRTIKRFLTINTNPEKGLLLNKWHENKLVAYGRNATEINDYVFMVYSGKDIHSLYCEELNVYILLRGNGELQNFLIDGKNYVTPTNKATNSEIFNS